MSQGSTANVVAALCSFFLPGLGQLLQGRIGKAILMMVLTALFWMIGLGWVIHIWAAIDAALYRKPGY